MKKNWCLFILFAIAIGCSEVKTPAPSKSGGAESGTSVSESVSVPFPHPENWSEANFHGTFVSQYGSSSCLRCHKAASEIPEVPPACDTCHQNYPHAPDWVKKEVHGSFVLKNGKNSCATQCHGFNLQGGLSQISCDLCHEVYPHTANWAQPQQHGETTKSNGTQMCQGCHGDDFKGGASGVSCFSCHERYPHPLGWVQKESHAAVVDQKGMDGCATLCHGSDLKGGLSGVSCDHCHHLYQNSTQNMQEIHRSGNCQGCHGPDWIRFQSNQCQLCHTNFPHPSAASWTQPSLTTEESCEETELGLECTTIEKHFLSSHAQQFFAQKEAGFPESFNLCSNCHGIDLQGGNVAPSCFSCHAHYPHFVDPNWRTPAGGNHTQAYLSGQPGLQSACTLCHTKLGKGIEEKAPACVSCHDQYPHAENWLSPLQHGMNFIFNEIAETAGDENLCQKCHGEDLRGEGAAAKDCQSCHEHELVVSHENCCVVAGRVPPGPWRNPAHHGRTYIQTRVEGNAGRCAACHNPSQKRPPNTVCNPFRNEFPASGLTWCSDCHTLPPDPPGPIGPCPADGCAATGGDCP